MAEDIRLRDVERDDLPELFAHQDDPVACRMAAFPSRDRSAFMSHWEKILADPHVIHKVILVGSKVAGNVVCFQRRGEWLLGYWLGRPFWGRGVASRAVSEFVSLVPTRPIFAYVAKTNAASIRVLEKCGFERQQDVGAGSEVPSEPLSGEVASLETPDSSSGTRTEHVTDPVEEYRYVLESRTRPPSP